MTYPASLLLIPDISGFTSFVHETELEHSQHIISGLLNTLIDADELDLTVAEIEGDAVLFYQEGRVPSAGQVLAQAHAFGAAFHAWIAAYVRTCDCTCAACRSVSRLSLKVVAHAGPLGFTTVHQQRKPFGETVVVAHRLLKNDIPGHEYLLLTEGLLGRPAPTLVAPGHEAQRGQATYPELGEIRFVYLPLPRPLRAEA